MPVSAQMPRYQCHKKVWALKIKAINPTNEMLMYPDYALHFEEEGYAPIRKSRDWMQKHSPSAGGYYVVYEDGYTSYSPAKAFEEGYRLIKPTRMSHLTNEQLVSKLLEEGADGFIIDEACDRLDPGWRDRHAES